MVGQLDADVAVVGAGPAGWAMAAACARLGLDTVFLTFDRTARQSYESRAQAAQGVVEGNEKG